jgi:hypothetical protein
MMLNKSLVVPPGCSLGEAEHVYIKGSRLCAAAYANDPTFGISQYQFRGSNVKLEETEGKSHTVHIHQSDFVKMYATADILKGDPIFLEYGDEYWAGVNPWPNETPTIDAKKKELVEAGGWKQTELKLDRHATTHAYNIHTFAKAAVAEAVQPRGYLPIDVGGIPTHEHLQLATSGISLIRPDDDRLLKPSLHKFINFLAKTHDLPVPMWVSVNSGCGSTKQQWNQPIVDWTIRGVVAIVHFTVCFSLLSCVSCFHVFYFFYVLICLMCCFVTHYLLQ